MFCTRVFACRGGTAVLLLRPAVAACVVADHFACSWAPVKGPDGFLPCRRGTQDEQNDLVVLQVECLQELEHEHRKRGSENTC